MILWSSADFFFKINFFKVFFQELYRSVKGLDPDQNRLSVGHDLDPNCLQKLKADHKIRR